MYGRGGQSGQDFNGWPVAATEKKGPCWPHFFHACFTAVKSAGYDGTGAVDKPVEIAHSQLVCGTDAFVADKDMASCSISA